MIRTAQKLESRSAAYSRDRCGFVDVFLEDEPMGVYYVARVTYEWDRFCRGDWLTPDYPGNGNILSVEVLSVESIETDEVTTGRESCQTFDARAEELVMQMRGIYDRIEANEPSCDARGRRWK